MPRGDLKVLFITGYAQNAAVGNGHLDAGKKAIGGDQQEDDHDLEGHLCLSLQPQTYCVARIAYYVLRNA